MKLGGPTETQLSGTLGQRIRQARKNRLWTLDKLATELGISKVSVWAWEQDRSKPRLHLLERLSELLEIPPRWLLSVEHAPSKAVLEVVAECQARIANTLNLPLEAVEIKITFGPPTNGQATEMSGEGL